MKQLLDEATYKVEDQNEKVYWLKGTLIIQVDCNLDSKTESLASIQSRTRKLLAQEVYGNVKDLLLELQAEMSQLDFDTVIFDKLIDETFQVME